MPGTCSGSRSRKHQKMLSEIRRWQRCRNTALNRGTGVCVCVVFVYKVTKYERMLSTISLMEPSQKMYKLKNARHKYRYIKTEKNFNNALKSIS